MGQEARPSPSAWGRVKVSGLRWPGGQARAGQPHTHQVLQHEGHQLLLQGFHQRRFNGSGVVLRLAVGADPAGQNRPILGAKGREVSTKNPERWDDGTGFWRGQSIGQRQGMLRPVPSS